ncbi:hypothetical protein FRB90_003732 [Tulasnella sp. 427]|nr:hypothetical protein FRB90_003732 [Tulasnella sp. 427]
MLLRDPITSPEALRAAKELRNDCATMLAKSFSYAESSKSAIPTELLSELVNYFESLAKHNRHQYYDEDLWVVSQFSAILGRLHLFDPQESNRHELWLSRTNSNRGGHYWLCKEVLRTFGELRARVYRIEMERKSAQQRQGKGDRDPAGRWCYC